MKRLGSFVNFLIPILIFIWLNSSVISFVVFETKIERRDSQHVTQVNIRKDGDNFNGTIVIKGQLWTINLKKPEQSVFGKHFLLQVAEDYVNDKEDVITIVNRKVIPGPGAIDSSVYVDKEIDAALSVRVMHKNGDKLDDSNFAINGYLNDYHISHDGEKHIARYIQPRVQNKDLSNSTISFESTDLKAKRKGELSKTDSGKSAMNKDFNIVRPEILIFVDYKLWTLLGSSEKNMLDYIAVFVHSMNNRYAHMTDPRIMFSVVGVVAITTTSRQEFLNSNKVQNESYDLHGVLNDFGSFIYKKKESYVAHDIAALLSGEDFASKNDKGQFVKGVAGLSFVGGACHVDQEMKMAFNTLVVNDGGASWLGVQTAVHEFAHNLGAPHDGKSGSESCSWDDGYIMSYAGDGMKNKFSFSNCSQSLMKAFINSKGGECLLSESSAPPFKTSNDFPGDRLSMDEQCKVGTGKEEATRDHSKSESDQCKRLYCKYEESCGTGCIRMFSIALGIVPGDNTPCGIGGGVCINGECVTKTL